MMTQATCKRMIGPFQCCSVVEGDCLELMKQLPDKCVDAVITDPPYGVLLGSVDNGQCREKGQQSYSEFEDTAEYVRESVVPSIVECLRISGRVIVTPGNRNAWLYPKPDDFGVWYNPAGTGIGKWGFILAHIILYYGKDPKAGRGSGASSAWALNDSVSETKNKLHPCPKPLKFASWLVTKGSTDGDTILDPFLGSGTTAVAAKKLGRHFLGMEISKTYCEIARERIALVENQGVLFQSKAEQLSLESK